MANYLNNNERIPYHSIETSTSSNVNVNQQVAMDLNDYNTTEDPMIDLRRNNNINNGNNSLNNNNNNNNNNSSNINNNLPRFHQKETNPRNPFKITNNSRKHGNDTLRMRPYFIPARLRSKSENAVSDSNISQDVQFNGSQINNNNNNNHHNLTTTMMMMVDGAAYENNQMSSNSNAFNHWLGSQSSVNQQHHHHHHPSNPHSPHHHSTGNWSFGNINSGIPMCSTAVDATTIITTTTTTTTTEQNPYNLFNNLNKIKPFIKTRSLEDVRVTTDYNNTLLAGSSASHEMEFVSARIQKLKFRDMI